MRRATVWTVPNGLTLFRLAAAPGLVLPYLALPRPVADAVALALFLVAAATDFLDGWLARRLGQESELGRVLDPIADKATVCVALLLLTGLWAEDGLAPAVAGPAALILFREILVAGLREALGPGAGLQVTPLAKGKTAVQMVAVGALFAAPLVAGLAPVAVGLLWLAAALTLVSGWDYAAKAVRHMGKTEEGTG